MALRDIVQSIRRGCSHVVDVDLQSYFDTIDHDLLLELVERRVGDVRVIRMIRAWLKAGVMEEGKVRLSVAARKGTNSSAKREPPRWLHDESTGR